MLQFPHLQNEDNNSLSHSIQDLKIYVVWHMVLYYLFLFFFPVSNQTSFGCSLFSSLKNY